VKRLRLPPSEIKISGFRPELRVVEYIATKKGDAERGPMLWISPADAKIRLLEHGELAWVNGPRRHELAVVQIDDSVPDGSVKLRDIAGVSVSERVVVTKPDVDSPHRNVG
jgi:anaerobic selenocysteine-containing dehydrogenase